MGPQVENITVVEIDNALMKHVEKHFPRHAQFLSDSRTTLVVQNVMQWLMDDDLGQFDIVYVDLPYATWRRPSNSTRIPRTRAFVQKLSSCWHQMVYLFKDWEVSARSDIALVWSIYIEARFTVALSGRWCLDH